MLIEAVQPVLTLGWPFALQPECHPAYKSCPVLSFSTQQLPGGSSFYNKSYVKRPIKVFTLLRKKIKKVSIVLVPRRARFYRASVSCSSGIYIGRIWLSPPQSCRIHSCRWRAGPVNELLPRLPTVHDCFKVLGSFCSPSNLRRYMTTLFPC